MTLLEETNSYLIPKRKLIIAWRNDHYIFKLFFRQMTQVFYFFCFCHFLLTFSKRKLIIAWRNDHYIFNIYDIQMIFCQMNLPVFYYFVKWHRFSPFFRFCHFLLFFSKLVFVLRRPLFIGSVTRPFCNQKSQKVSKKARLKSDLSGRHK